MKKVFVSMPVCNKDTSEIISALSSYLSEPLMLIENFIDDDAGSLEKLGESIKRMNIADYILFGESWENSRGCRIEHECAKEYDKKIFCENEGLITEKY